MEFQNRPATVIIASLVIVVSLAFIWFKFRTPPIPYDLTEARALATGCGEALATETIQAIHDRGRIVVVAAFDMQRARNVPWMAFSNKLKEHPSINITVADIVPPDPSEPMACSSAAFQKLLEQSGQADALVFFCGLPKWSQAEPFAKPVNAKIVVLDINGIFLAKTRYSGYFEHGILSVLIRLRGAASAAAPVSKPKSPHEWFDRSYKVFTPENYDSLPDDAPPGMPRRPGS